MSSQLVSYVDILKIDFYASNHAHLISFLHHHHPQNTYINNTQLASALLYGNEASEAMREKQNLLT